MAVTYQDYVAQVKSSVAQRILKIEVLDNNENIIDTITPDIISGDLQLSSDSGARRSCNIVFNNYQGDFIPVPGEKLWINSKFRLWTGLKVNNEDYFISRGIFISGEPEINSNRAENICSLQLYDKWVNLDGSSAGTLDVTYKIPAGTDLESAVRQVFSDAGEIKPVIFEPITATLPYTVIIEPNGTYADILLKLADMVSYVVYYDNNGYPRFEPPVDIDTAGSIWDFTTNEGLYLGSRKRYEYSKVKNFCKVIGANVNGQIYKGEASDTNIASSTRIDLIGKRALVITDDNIYSNALALERANFELQKAIQVIESVNAESIPIDVIEGDSLITITDSSAGFDNSRYLVKTVTFPLLNDGNMSMSVWNARSLLSS